MTIQIVAKIKLREEDCGFCIFFLCFCRLPLNNLICHIVAWW